MDSDIIYKGRPDNFYRIIWGILAAAMLAASVYGFYMFFVSCIQSHVYVFSGVEFLLPLLLISVSAVLFYLAFSSIKELTVTNQEIILDKKQIRFSDIVSTSLDGMGGNDASGNPIELVVITSKSGDVTSINVNNYHNGYLFRSVCEKNQQNVLNGIFVLDQYKPYVTSINQVSFNDLKDQDFKKFMANPFTTFYFWLGLVFPILGVHMLTGLKDIGIEVVIAVIFVTFLMFLIFNVTQYYFLVSPDYLIIKHHFFPFQTEVIPMKDIKRFSAVSMGRSIGVMILFKDYRWNRTVTHAAFKSSLGDLVKAVNDNISN